MIGTLFTYTSQATNNTYYSIILKAGKIVFEAHGWDNGMDVLPNVSTTSSNMYDLGWNLVCITEGNNDLNFYSFVHFSTTPLTETKSSNGHLEGNSFGLIFGSFLDYSSETLKWSFQGIIHSAYFRDNDRSGNHIRDNYLTPRSSPAYACDYFSSYFHLMTSMTGNNFYNGMFGYQGQNVVFTNSLGSQVDSTDGLSFSPVETQSITGISATLQKAIGIRFWFKGDLATNTNFLAIHSSGTGDFAVLKTNGNDIEATQIFSSDKITFSNAKSTLSSSSWTMFGLSVGYIARGSQYIMCAYVYQSGYEQGS